MKSGIYLNIFIVAGFASGMLVLFLFTERLHEAFDDTGAHRDSPQPEIRKCLRIVDDINRVLLQQRNNLSKLLNMKQKKIGQLECEKTGEISKTGGWCLKQNEQYITYNYTDVKLVAVLIKLLEGKTVGSFGDGPGTYKRVFDNTGKLKRYDAYDGSPFCDVTSNGSVMYLDLTIPQYGLPLYDWIISLEVAEHIPMRFESIYIDNVVRHAREGVILSWAKRGQNGYYHVNNRPLQYVKGLMKALGFKHDDRASKELKSRASIIFLQWNTNIYRRANITSRRVLSLQA